MMVWLAQMPSTIPDLVWWVLAVGALPTLYALLRLGIREPMDQLKKRVEKLEEWKEDVDRFEGEIAEKVQALREGRR